MSEATPRPWHRSHREWDDSDTICAEYGRCVAVRPSLVSADGWTPDAALIVRAVNAFDDLVAAIEPIMREAQEQTDFADPSWNESAHIELTLTIGEIRAIVAAIAKART